eukprot:CAMPEP_0203743086 /NCGR_PEP_ID=MMETSP0092-20131115/59258_1 /ASSEMBLY_ACC=CAM_ASM_001090 /TAXON_ID=426623 /ORGANISM="Chaetoceros affinis, Strain CCMP159" /LENGTH=382 /DNA_ID=CAMNT_0050630367 /DNA_START=24 /DNA_END=1169 /DNA_ORIENTATION=+
MREYDVDLYLCGEVHSTTVIKDTDSNLIQIASRGNKINNFIKIEVTDDSLLVKHYNEVGNKEFNNQNYELNGELLIDKSGSDTLIKSNGALELLNTKKVLILYDFEELFLMSQRQVIGLKQIEMAKKVGLIASTTTMRGVTCDESLPNLGKFGQSYDAQVAGLSLNHDHPISGEKFAFFSYSGETRVSTWGIGPHSSGSSISFALWIRTWIQEEMILVHYGAAWRNDVYDSESDIFSLTLANGEMILVHYGAAWRNDVYDSESDIFSLTLANGRPRLYARENKILTTETNISLNDGQWHHIAVSMPYNNCLLANVEMIIDGKKVKTKGPEKDEALFFIHYGRVSLGGLGYSDSVYETRFPNWNPYKGSMDRFLLWARPLYNW